MLGFGFLGGLLARMGVDPEIEILKTILEATEAPAINVLLFVFTLVFTVGPILGAYSIGGKLGLLAVAIAWISGFIIVSGSGLTVFGALLLISAMFIGAMAPDSKL